MAVSATWDVTAVHTLAAFSGTGSKASERKSAKYSSLTSRRIFGPAAIETLRPLSDEAQHFLAQTGRRAALRTADLREAAYLYQRISVSIQHFDAVRPANSLTISKSPS